MGQPPRGRDRPGRHRPDEIARRAEVVQGVAIVIGVGIALVGASLVAISLAELFTGGETGETPAVTSLGRAVVFVAMIWWGLQIAWPSLGPRALLRRFQERRSGDRGHVSDPSSPAATEADSREQRVLRLAEQEHGRLAVLETAARCDLTVEEAKALLDGLVLRKIAELQVSEGGVLVYVFPRLLRGRGRARQRRQR